jgi:chromosome segregation ATPase
MLRRSEEEKAITAESNGKLIDAVEQLEVSLQSPIVPGEMVAWAETLRKSLNALRSPLKEQINQVHQQTIKQIAIEDPELTVRAVNLNSTDEQNLQEFERLLKYVWNLPERVSKAEPDEGSMMTELRELIDDGLKFVLSVRGQEPALSTWINESLNRDRGDGD